MRIYQESTENLSENQVSTVKIPTKTAQMSDLMFSLPIEIWLCEHFLCFEKIELVKLTSFVWDVTSVRCH